jgi:hypothetical protein
MVIYVIPALFCRVFHYLSDFNLADFVTEFRRFSDFEDLVGRREGLQQWWGSIVLPKFAVLFKRGDLGCSPWDRTFNFDMQL